MAVFLIALGCATEKDQTVGSHPPSKAGDATASPATTTRTGSRLEPVPQTLDQGQTNVEPKVGGLGTSNPPASKSTILSTKNGPSRQNAVRVKPTKEELALIAKENGPIVGKWLESGADGTKAKIQFDADGTGFGYASFPPAPDTPIMIKFNYVLRDNKLMQRPTSAQIGAKTGDLKAAQMVVDGLNKSFRSVVYTVQARPRPMTWVDKNTFTLASTYGPSNTFKRAPWSAP